MSHKPSTNKFLKSSSSSTSSSSSFLSPDTRDTRDTRTNSFLGRDVLEVELVKEDKDINNIKDVKDVKIKEEVEEFPVLGGRRPAATTTEKKGLVSTPAPQTQSEAEAGGLRGPCPLLYKTALLTKINHSHIEEQARIQKALRREMEAKENRLRQMELSSMRERFVADAVHGCGSMAYDDDPGQKYSRRHDDDDDE
jgi:hypothetical protein